MSVAGFSFTDRARPIVQIGIGDTRVPVGAGRWNQSLWNGEDATWAGVEPLWFDVTCDVESIEITVGRERVLERFAVGTATIIVHNSTGWADPGPPTQTVLTMRPGRPVRVGVDHVDLGVRWLFRGIVDEIDPTYDPVDIDTVRIGCIDALGDVNRAKMYWAGSVGGGETGTVRVNRILDAAYWWNEKRDIDATSVTLLGTELTGQVADMLQRTADSVGGAIFGDLDGNIAFRRADWQTYLPGTPVDGTIGNVGSDSEPVELHDAGQPIVWNGTPVIFGTTGDASDDVCPTAWHRPFRRADIATRVLVGRAGVALSIVDDVPAQGLYGIEPFERLGLDTQHQADLDALARRLMLTRSAANAPRVRSVELNAATAPNVVDFLCTVDVWKPSRYRCRLVQPRGLVFDAEHFATGIRHSITRDVWEAEVNLDPSQAWEAIPARWNEGRWNQSTWADVGVRDLLDEARAIRAELTGSRT